MIIRKLSLINYRNYKKLTIQLHPSTNIFIGNNAQGKTNILESIYFLAITKSYRTTNDHYLIKNQESCLKVKAEIKDSNIYKSMAIELQNDTKKVKINENEVKKMADYVTNLNVILVAPEDLEIIQGSPAERRNFLNIELSQLSKIYIKKYNEFNKLLKIRNDYLKMSFKSNLADQRYLDSITENLIDREIYIYQEREKFIALLNEQIKTIYKNISGIEGLHINYQTNIEFDNFESESLREKIKEKYKKARQKEMENGMTLYGPHRDELEFYINDSNLKIYGSQGQQKLAIIALKLSEIKIFEQLLGRKPIILLDDVFSELDKTNRNKLIKYIDKDIQTIITTNDTKGISKILLNHSKIYHVYNGKIIEEGEENDRK